MAKNLLIVESPAKAKTIEKILGKDFSVKSSMGHIRDLPKSGDAVDVEKGFQPKYVVTPDKQKVVKDLKASVKKVDEVWLATDEDREGEAISWHLCEVLGLDENTTKRIVFREITKPAIQKAIQNPRLVDKHLVNAQQARRILDRLVGFELSGLLWKKVKGQLSAGRVQSVTLKLVVEREREIINFEINDFFTVYAYFTVENQMGTQVTLRAELPRRLQSENEARTFLEKCKGAAFTIGKIDKRPLKRKPAPPFTTSTLQQDASRKLGFSVRNTMSTAQRLYEQGHITYMRTDSTNLSETAVAEIATLIEQDFGSDYLQIRKYKSKNKGAQEAHEAIRPTNISREVVTTDSYQQRLYDLIRKRTLASQMADAQLEKTVVKIDISTQPGEHLQAEGEVLKFQGFLRVYMESTDDDDEVQEAKGILPPLKIGQQLPLDYMQSLQRFTRPPARFTEAALVKKLEELGIGRPSTYAPTISKIMEEKRGYVSKQSSDGEERNYTLLELREDALTQKQETERAGTYKNRLVPNDIGIVVTDFLENHFSNIMDYGFTAGIEEEFDSIADGEKEWNKMLSDFYSPFHEHVQHTLENAERTMGERMLGTDPESGRTVLVRMSRFGKPVVQIGKPDELGEEEKPRYANLQPHQSMETLEYEEAMKLFVLPRQLGDYQGQAVDVNVGRYGPYVRHGEGFFASVPKGEDVYSISKERAIELIEAKREENKPVLTYKGEPVTKGKGRFGPFLKMGSMYINIPRRYDPENLTQDEMIELIEAKIEKEKNRYISIWEEDNVKIENGRWGPFIRFGKKSIKIPKVNDKRITAEEARDITLEDAKALIEAEIPDAFKKKTRKRATKSKKK